MHRTEIEVCGEGLYTLVVQYILWVQLTCDLKERESVFAEVEQ